MGCSSCRLLSSSVFLLLRQKCIPSVSQRFCAFPCALVKVLCNKEACLVSPLLFSFPSCLSRPDSSFSSSCAPLPVLRVPLFISLPGARTFGFFFGWGFPPLCRRTGGGHAARLARVGTRRLPEAAASAHEKVRGPLSGVKRTLSPLPESTGFVKLIFYFMSFFCFSSNCYALLPDTHFLIFANFKHLKLVET